MRICRKYFLIKKETVRNIFVKKTENITLPEIRFYSLMENTAQREYCS